MICTSRNSAEMNCYIINRIQDKLVLSKSYVRVEEIIFHAEKHVNELFDSFNKFIDCEELTSFTHYSVRMERAHIFEVKLIASYLTELKLLLYEKYGKFIHTEH